MICHSQFGIKALFAQFISCNGSHWIELRTIDTYNDVHKETIHFPNAAYAEALAAAINSVPQPESTEQAA